MRTDDAREMGSTSVARGMRALVRYSAAALVIALAAPASAAEKEPDRSGGPYVPTPKIVVDHMLRMGNVGPDDFVVDLGSGDGVIVLTAARERKARGYGVDIDAGLVAMSNAEAKRLGVADRAAFRVQDVFKADLSRATVVTLYLLPAMMVNLRSKVYLETRPGTRVVSHDYTFDEWQPDEHIQLDVPEKEPINGSPTATIHLWIVPAKVAGPWQVAVERGERYDVDLQQVYQLLLGSAQVRGRPALISTGRLRGADIEFTVSEGGERRQFNGTVKGDTMEGSVDLGNGRTARWSASRK